MGKRHAAHVAVDSMHHMPNSGGFNQLTGGLGWWSDWNCGDTPTVKFPGKIFGCFGVVCCSPAEQNVFSGMNGKPF